MHTGEIRPDWAAGISIGAIQLSTDRRQLAREACIAVEGVLAFGHLGSAAAEMVHRWAGPVVAE